MLGYGTLISEIRALHSALSRKPAAGEVWCPHLREACWQHACVHYQPLVMTKHPQTGKDLPEYGCAMNHGYLATLAAASEVVGAHTAIVNFRNMLARQGDELLSIVNQRVPQNRLPQDHERHQ